MILPAFDEARRLPPYLAAVRAYLDGSYGRAYEVIVVDDGSRDATAEIVAGLAGIGRNCGCCGTPTTRAKGPPCGRAFWPPQGDLLLFADADGAAPIEEMPRLAAAIAAGADVAVGSRLCPTGEVRRGGTGIAGWPAGSSPPPPGGCWASVCWIRSAASRCSAPRPREALRGRHGNSAISSTWNCLLLAKEFD